MQTKHEMLKELEGNEIAVFGGEAKYTVAILSPSAQPHVKTILKEVGSDMIYVVSKYRDPLRVIEQWIDIAWIAEITK